jgi:tol-pal system protein YbgF
MKLQTLRALAALGLAGSLVGCVTPAPSAEDPTQIRIATLEQKVAALETKLRGLGNADVLGQLEGIEKRERDVRGQLEKVGYDLESAQRRQRQLYRDLDSRLQNLETSGSSKPASSSSSASAADGYQSAFGKLKNGEIDTAIASFQAFLAENPDSELAGNAHYWLGEAHYVKREYSKAGGEFATVVNQHESSTKVKDALLKLGYVKYEQKEFKSAREILSKVMDDFPGTTVASLADQRIQLMDKNGQ